MPGTMTQRLAYRDKFRSLHNEAFQSWFEELARALHPVGDFQPIRKTRGDGGLDGFAINSQLVYQVFAPARIHELRDSETAAKIAADFQTAYATMGGHLKSWVFVHNHPEGKIGQLSAAAITRLKTEHPAVEIGVLNIDALWEKLKDLDERVIEALVGGAPARDGREGSPPLEENIPAAVKALLDEGSKLSEEGRYAEARRKFEEAKQAAEEADSAEGLLKCRIDIAETRILEHSDLSVARDGLSACLRELPADAGGPRRQHVLGLLADAEILLGNVEEARSLYRQALQIARQRQSRFGEAHYLIGLSRAEELLGSLEEAHRLLDEAAELYRAEYREAPEGERRTAAINLGASLSTKANLLRHEARLTEAVVCLARAEALFRESNSLDNLGRTLALKGEVLLTEAKWQDGLDALREALSTFESIDNVYGQCRCLEDMAGLFWRFDQADEAQALLGLALRLVLGPGRPEIEAVPYLLKFARLCGKHGEPEKVKAFIEQAKSIASKAGADSLMAECLMAEAGTLDGDEARTTREQLLRSAVRHLEAAIFKCEVRGRRAEYMREIGEIYGSLREIHEARAWFEKALAEHEEIGDLVGIANSLTYLVAAAREQNSPAEAVTVLERLLELSRGKPLHHVRAGALHDLGSLKLSQGDVDGARRCFEEAESLAEKHNFADVSRALKASLERLGDAERFYQPPRGDLPSLVRELHAWCARYPTMRDAILPLWYYVHRAELWGICRSMLGVKFLIRTSDPPAFASTANLLRGQGDLYVFGTAFVLQAEQQTELVPWSPDVLIPPHLKLAFFKGSSPDPAVAAKALVNALRDETYLLVPFNATLPDFPDTELYAFGRHIRLPPTITGMMLDTPAEELISNRWISLPLGERDDAPTTHRTMLSAWENGMIPIFVGGLPDSEKVRVACDSFVDVPTATPAAPGAEAFEPTAKGAWDKLVSTCRQGPQASLSEFSREMAALTVGPGRGGVLRVRVFALRFRAGNQEVIHPAVTLAPE